MKLAFTTLDVFTTERFIGNPLAIIRVPAAYRDRLSEEQKQKIAAEFNLSESVFLHEAGKDDEIVHYDIFTAKVRVSFAGHPTIGTSIYILKHARAEFPSVHTLSTVAGRVPITMDPATSTASVAVPHDVHIHATRLPHPIPSAAGGDGSPTVPLVSIVKGMAFNLVPFTTLEALASVSDGLIPAPDVYRATHLDAFDGWNFGVTGTFYYVDLGTDDRGRRLLRTRMMGSREDPGTGSASSALCCYLSLLDGRESGNAGGSFEFHLVQGVEMGRRCDIFVKVVTAEDGERVEEVTLSGNAVTVMEGFVEV